MNQHNPLEMVGRRVEMLTVIERLPGSKVRCKCDCGAEKVLMVGHFNSGKMKSCGCHTGWTGQSESRAHDSWGNMKARCQNPKNKRFKDYGAKGIFVCERWQTFREFYEDMGDCPLGMTIERIDTRKGYEPGNCEWATRTKQQRNRLLSRRWIVRGVTYETAAEAGKALGVSSTTIKAWCDGRVAEGRWYPPKSDCSTVPVYA